MRGSTTSKLLATMQKMRIFQFNHLIPQTNTFTKQQSGQIQKDALASLSRRIPIYLASIFGFVSIGTITHLNDDYYPYYPLPFALDIGEGGSMMPTILPAEVYLRDCFNDRFFWLNWQHLQQVWPTRQHINRSTSTDYHTTTQHESTYKRPYQKGDVVTIFNPFSKTLISKRIVGIEGDTVLAFGEYAQSYHEMGKDDCGVPADDRYAIPYCQQEAQNARASNHNNGTGMPLYQATITVPKDHVWVEGDNPLCSIDSRHYGPLPISSLRGRVVVRLWPIRREPDFCTLSDGRPAPFMSVDEIFGERKAT
jgi:signal peptidase I